MQKFEMPMMSVEEFEIVDVIMTSVEACLDDNEVNPCEENWE